MIAIKNKGQALVETNYWDSEMAMAGDCYLSWNAGAARLLVPDNQKLLLREMKGAREVLISRGPFKGDKAVEAIELLWQYDAEDPFQITIGARQTDRLIPAEDQGGGFSLIAYTRGGEKGRWPARYRIVPSLPWLKPWGEH